MAEPLDFEALAAQIESELAQYISLELIEQVLSEAIYEAMRASLSGATREGIVRAAAEAAGKKVTGEIAEAMKRQIAETIADGLERQLGVEGTARNLREGLGLDSNRQKSLEKYRKELEDSGVTGQALDDAIAKRRQELINDRAITIAHTEMAQAMESGHLELALERGDTHKVWITSGDSKVSDECMANQGAGPIAIKDNFPGSGTPTAPGHVACRCSVAYIKDEGKGELDRARKRAEERQARLEAAKAEADK